MSTPESIQYPRASFIERHTPELVAGLFAAGVGAVACFLTQTAPSNAEREITNIIIQHEQEFEQLKAINPSLDSITFEDGSICTEALKRDGLRRRVICTVPQR